MPIPSRVAWSRTTCARRDLTRLGAGLGSGRRAAGRHRRRAAGASGGSRGKSFSPSSRSSSTSARLICQSSGSATWMSVVPRIATVPTGTMMSPSAGLWQRLMTASVMRWLKTSIVPLPGAIASFAPAIAATCPPHAPAADTIWPAITRYSVPLRTSTTRAASSRSPERSNPTTRWYGRAALPRAAASATLPSISDHGSTGRIRNGEGASDPGVEGGIPAEDLRDVHLRAIDVARRAQGGELVDVVVRIVRRRDEVAAGVLDREGARSGARCGSRRCIRGQRRGRVRRSARRNGAARGSGRSCRCRGRSGRPAGCACRAGRGRAAGRRRSRRRR